MTNPLNLKPCPFCGSPAKSMIDYVPTCSEHEKNEVVVYCPRCLARQSDIDHAGVDHVERARDVIKRWNRRVNVVGFKP